MLPIAIPQAMAAVLGLFIVVFVLWAAIADDPFGGEPTAVASTPAADAPEAKKPDAANAATANANAAPGSRRYDGPDPAPASPNPAGGGQTISIIDGSTGKRQDVVIPGPAGAKQAPPVDAKLLETSRHGAIPKIAPDGTRPSDAYARTAKTASGNPDGPRIALIVGGLGVGAQSTADALAKMPAPVTLAFTPYGNDLENLTTRARGEGHEILLQIPMEPFDYPDNDPGPQTLLTSLSAEQNIDRLQWLFSRFQGYVGIENFMGARFTASEPAISSVLRETAKRGLLYVDDGSSARSLTSQIAGANKLPFAKADVVIDAVPTTAEIDKALARLEAMAKERGVVVGMGSGLPVTIDRVAKWTKAATARGIVLVPISAVAVRAKSS
jgi:polysaccharide deacetylase 2 family uncharacterized protein YibQ